MAVAPRVLTRLCLVLALALVATLASTGISGAQVASAESMFFDRLNEARASVGLPALVVHPELTSVARDWTATMVSQGGIAHRPDLADVVTADWRRLGENVGRSQKTGAGEAELVARLHAAFLASPGHRANLLGDYNTVGIGAQVTGDGWMYVTVNFMLGPLPQNPAPPESQPDPEPAPEPEPDPDPAPEPAPEPEPQREAPVDVNPVVNEAVRVSRAVFDDAGGSGRQASYALVARGDVFADALGGAALAADRGPVLYTAGPSDADANPALNATTRAELDRILGGRGGVYLLGGPAAVSDRAAQELASAGYTVKRLSGKSRVETAVRVAEEVVAIHGSPDRVLLARSDEWPDAVTGGAYAAATGNPMVLTQHGSLHPATAAFLASLGGADRVALGGTAALAEGTVKAAGASRVFGKDRTGTAVAVAEQLWARTDGTDGDHWTLAPSHGDSAWAYALAQSPWAAANTGPQLLIYDQIPPSVEAYLAQLDYVGKGASTEWFVASDLPSEVVGEVAGLAGR